MTQRVVESPGQGSASPKSALMRSCRGEHLRQTARHDKRAYVFPGALTLATIRLWLR
ncbi:hypothetical protein ABZ642_15795 [Streptomyces sp. NPDC007157]|uniref:hypothetical protein n=1 Tax=Streptomyces sp. NPDC007157 TaxID=3154681 RepID=UPI0033CB50E0